MEYLAAAGSYRALQKNCTSISGKSLYQEKVHCQEFKGINEQSKYESVSIYLFLVIEGKPEICNSWFFKLAIHEFCMQK